MLSDSKNVLPDRQWGARMGVMKGDDWESVMAQS